METTAPVYVLPRESSFKGKVLPLCYLALGFVILVTPFSIGGVSFDLGKKLILFVGTITLFITWLLGRIIHGNVEIPRTLFFWFPPIAFCAILLSTIFSSNTNASLTGVFFDNGTTITLGVLLMVLFLWGVYMRTEKRVAAFIVSFFGVFWFVFFIQVAHIFFSLPVPGLLLPSDTLLGQWNNLGIFAGLITVFSVVLIRARDISTRTRLALLLSLLFSLSTLAVVNFDLVWWVVLITVVLILLHHMVTRSSRASLQEDESLPVPVSVMSRGANLFFLLSAIITVLLCTTFIIWGKETIVSSGTNISSERGPLAGWSRSIAAAPLEARPFESGLMVTVKSLKEEPLWGTGPNRFFEAWDTYKPSSVQTAPFWNSDFNTSFGFLPTLLVTLGGIGIVPWILAGLIFIRAGFSVLFSPIILRAGKSGYVTIALFFGAFFLLLMSVMYVPDISLLFATFAIMGTFMGHYATRDDLPLVTLYAAGAPLRGFVGIILAVLLTGLAATGLYMTVRNSQAQALFQTAAISFNQKDPENNEQFEIAIRAVQKALRIRPSDYFYRELTRLHMAELSFSLNDNETAPEIRETRIRESFNGALESSLQAINLDKNQYQNYMARAAVFEAAVALQIPGGALEQTRASYEDARMYNPNKPLIAYRMARLELAGGDKTKAEEYLNDALGLKPDYVAALFLLAQISADEGDLSLSIKNLEQVLMLNPNDVNLLFQIGFLRYRNKEFKAAIDALERAKALQPNYSDAKYFLGLAYARNGQNALAIKEFEDVRLLNPGHAETESILTNLRAGRDPFAGSALDVVPPERRDAPPVSSE